ncbi:flagellar hook-basal body complex protein FliE [Gallaecimonas xiamenensis]|uniref:Flagellar hook-basal body complex protein FliE n=1 Tax=Gallaecimonas xiamenensis 3-C-1 TaxID=745411 RepID=K2JU94_9GAMM|nr:flagellar hook-basal body complex protein FliE [Gallaecimonas xiamenensis]EKE73964.1 lateral flagellar hook basal body protein, LfiE [Gallaecimonas xiamenensis 3-C-1]
MKIDNISTQASLLQQLNRLSLEADGISPNRIAGQGEGSFTDAMKAAVNKVDFDQKAAGDLMTAVETGQSDDLVGAMVASQKAGLSFSALVQVRNKLVSAFDDIMRMPV